MRSIDKAIKALDRSGVHIIEYIDIDGKKQKETIKGEVREMNNRVNTLKQHGCKIIKTNVYANW